MKTLYIIKSGTTFPVTAKKFGDFETWTLNALGEVGLEISVLDAQSDARLPAPAKCAGVVITGSHSMVTEDLPWSARLERWLQTLLKSCIPLFGICYGHQLLARAAGGQVDFHPLGKEIGTVFIDLLPGHVHDALFGLLPRSFLVHVTHSQSVLRLPPGAIRLAANSHEPNHAFRLGDCAWGVQFHPEYNSDIMKSYIQEQSADLSTMGIDASALIQSVTETPFAAGTIKAFARFVEERLSQAN